MYTGVCVCVCVCVVVFDVSCVSASVCQCVRVSVKAHALLSIYISLIYPAGHSQVDDRESDRISFALLNHMMYHAV